MQLQCTAALAKSVHPLWATYPPASPSAECQRVGHCSITEGRCCEGFAVWWSVQLCIVTKVRACMCDYVHVCIISTWLCVQLYINRHVWAYLSTVCIHVYFFSSCRCCRRLRKMSIKGIINITYVHKSKRTPFVLRTLSKLELWQCGPRFRLSRSRALALSL